MRALIETRSGVTATGKRAGNRRIRSLGLALAFALSCGDDQTSSSQETHIGQSAVSKEPDPPEGYSGDPWSTLPISPEEQAALDQAWAISALRNSPTQNPVDRGFASAPVSPTASPKGAHP